MEISLVSPHLEENVLEEYVFGRLIEAKEAVLEEHLLICPRCQTALAETEDYIQLMKFAAARPLEIRRRLTGRRSAIAAAGLLAAACIAIFSWFKPNAATISGRAGTPSR